tara:strand:- start:140 stop:745 length:606 start_codon:yes stop_codon:yes gene_type:complete
MDKEEKLEFSEGDIETLDFIIDEVIKSDFGILSDSIQIKEYPKFNFNKGGYTDLQNRQKREKEFVRILGIISSYNCAICEFRDIRIIDSETSIRKSKNTLQFKNLGGFRKVYEDNIKYKKRQEKIIRKEATDLWIASNTKRTFWFIMIGGFVSWGFTFYNNYINDKNNSTQIEHIRQLQQENKEQVKELRTLIVSQKKDSL